jgi:site-specific DNA-methyltransferase (adenine-specific)
VETLLKNALKTLKISRSSKLVQLQLFTSNSDEWETPDEVYTYLNSVYNFDLDVAASDTNHLCPTYFSESNSALSQPWKCNSAFCNPPYSRKLQRAFIIKAIAEVSKGNANQVVFLLPARLDTVNWHDYLFPHASEVWFIRGRLKFSNSGAAPFPSCVVVLRKSTDSNIIFRAWNVGTQPITL